MKVDPITFEIIRHRLDSINEEAAITLRHVSGSQIAVESNDLNTVITTAEGRVVACGHYVLCQVVSINLVIADITSRYRENPGFRAGDQFLTNDPYIGTLHQPDVVLVAPIFYDDELIAWTGSTVHQSDVGGPSPGGMSYGASSIFDEPIPLPPIKIVEGDVLRQDIEREYLIRSRTPDLNALDLAGQVAANRTAISAVVGLCERYSVDTVIAAMGQLLEGAERQLRQRLATLPDGRWRHTAYIEQGAHPGDSPSTEDVYAVRLTMTKLGSELELDFSASSDQAPGAINSGYPSLANFSMAAVLIYLCGGLLWVPGALWPVVRIVSREGSVVHARWPAGLAMRTATSAQAIRICVNACLARMLESSEELSSHLMASCQSAGAGGGVFSGVTDEGQLFASMTLDDATGGGGARSFADGADSSGLTTSPGAGCANVEVNESYLPILYLRRAESPDSGGPGRFRGGVGCTTVLRAHHIATPIGVLSFGQGLQHPAATGIAGGGFGRQSVFAILPTDEVDALLDGGSLGDPHLPMPSRGMTITSGQAHIGMSQGGGGFGDPLDRDPHGVAADVTSGLVSAPGARRDYGVVVVDEDDHRRTVDLAATSSLRDAIRRQRIDGREPKPAVEQRQGRRFSMAFDVIGHDDGAAVCCARCATAVARADGDVYAGLVVREQPIEESAPWGLAYQGGERFVVRNFFCPGCGTQVDVQVSLRGEPPLRAIEPILGHGSAHW